MLRLFFIVILASSGLYGLAQTTYTWAGTTSSDWASGSNWSPTGIPSNGDDVILDNGSVPNACTLDANRTIDVLTIPVERSGNGWILDVRLLPGGLYTVTSGSHSRLIFID